MKGPFYHQPNLINYDLLEDNSNFGHVDIDIDKIKQNYDVDIKEKI